MLANLLLFTNRWWSRVVWCDAMTNVEKLNWVDSKAFVQAHQIPAYINKPTNQTINKE
jgi:hypothetical protein